MATFRITFDAPPGEATLELVDPSREGPEEGRAGARPDDPAAPARGRRVGRRRSTSSKDLEYRVVARTADGRVLPKNKYRIDVREDRAPRVAFDEPDEALEVHPIAEVRHRVRVDDDFGLTRAGIVFRFNDGEEKTLILRDFPLAKGQKPKTSATLEEMLLMETLAATPQDSVTYYAFAEDNFPGHPEADRDRPPVHRHPRLQARVQAGRARLRRRRPARADRARRADRPPAGQPEPGQPAGQAPADRPDRGRRPAQDRRVRGDAAHPDPGVHRGDRGGSPTPGSTRSTRPWTRCWPSIDVARPVAGTPRPPGDGRGPQAPGRGPPRARAS